MTQHQARERRRLQRQLTRCKALTFRLQQHRAALTEATAEAKQLHGETQAVTGTDPAVFQVLADALAVQLDAARARVLRLAAEVQRLAAAFAEAKRLLNRAGT